MIRYHANTTYCQTNHDNGRTTHSLSNRAANTTQFVKLSSEQHTVCQTLEANTTQFVKTDFGDKNKDDAMRILYFYLV